MKPWIEPTCCAIVALYLALKLRREPSPRAFLRRMACLVAASWLVENSVIEAYGFYHYNPSWTLFVHHVPAMVIVIWPVVIHSAWDLARALLRDRRHLIPLVAASFVLADAALIEPIAVHAGLWSWTVPGLFGVPLIGMVGWALFALPATFFLDRGRLGLLVLGAPLVTHALLLILWWSAFRWFATTVPPVAALGLLAVTTVTTTSLLFRARLRQRVDRSDLLSRAPGAIFFFVLLGVSAPPLALVGYALLFAPPYLALLDPQPNRARLSRSTGSG